MNLSAQIHSSIKKNISRKEHSIVELEEKFFDSIQWLESDSEDFFSVNGDFTFSCGNSPKNLKTWKENSLTDTKK
ncbi:hypothetical protein E1A91_D12G171900v1 [Gossypium mustelinum]|uniref:Uncharacterized protein n=1 Tax=Gossypium mustelinum TaxID=34275 RepID=A0A5D2SET7_GOSMU|nr:hypothetical protein E1A91_D12G171900v1 [Gossypium mustelinum]